MILLQCAGDKRKKKNPEFIKVFHKCFEDFFFRLKFLKKVNTFHFSFLLPNKKFIVIFDFSNSGALE